MRKRIALRWRSEARYLYAKHGNNTKAIEAEIRQKYGNLLTVLTIIRIILSIIQIWQKLKIEEPCETPSQAEIDLVEYTEEEGE